MPAAIGTAMPAAECWGALTGSGQTLFDNRKAGKSTPIIPTGLRSTGTSWRGFITSLLELSKTVENKGSSNNCLMKCGNESQCPVALGPTQFQQSRSQGVWSRRQSGRRSWTGGGGGDPAAVTGGELNSPLQKRGVGTQVLGNRLAGKRRRIG